MPKLPFQLAYLKHELEGDYQHLEPLRFPELSRLGADPEAVRVSLRRNIQRLIKSVDPATLYARRAPQELTLDAITLTLQPPAGDLAWREAIELRLQFVTWKCGGGQVTVAYVPALDIDVLVRSGKDVGRQVELEVRAALGRERMFRLGSLTRLAQSHGCELIRETAEFDSLTTAAWSAKRDRNADSENDSALKEVATNLRREPLPQAYECDSTVRTLARLLQSPKSPHVILVGPSGVGKTAAFYELVRQRKTLGMSGREFWETSGARLVAGMSGFGMWQERCQRLLKETSERDVVLLLGNLVELMEVGQSVHNEQSIASFLRNALYRGELTAVTECTEAQLSVIEREDPQLLAAFQPLRVAPPQSAQLQSILLSAAVERAPQSSKKNAAKKKAAKKETAQKETAQKETAQKETAKRRKSKEAAPVWNARGISTQALVTMERVHARFATYSAAPGRPLRFLRNLVFGDPAKGEVESAEVIQAFAKETGLPLFLLDEAAAMSVQETRDWFRQRLIGQEGPVDVVVDLLATMKAGLSRPDRPLASLLFIGPTGVGKTELAKSIAAFLYHNERRLVRYDMSEFADPIAVDRLIGGSFASEGLLTRRIREQPFTVVLFDEVEKADPGFFDLLLQILGEGRLTDSSGRVADFRNSVIVMTSNLGAESFRGARMGLGEVASQQVDAETFFVRRVREFIRPELYNRLDRVVPFAPLEENAIERIAEREITKLQQRDGVKYRDIDLSISSAAYAQLASDGVESTLGARPLKRVIERTIAGPLATRLNNHTPGHSFVVDIDSHQGRCVLHVKAEPARASRLTATLHDTLHDFSQARRRVQQLAHGATALRLRNELYRLEQRVEKRRRHVKAKELEARAFLSFEEEKRLERLRQILADTDSLSRDACQNEEEALLAFYRGREVNSHSLEESSEELSQRLRRILIEIFRFDSQAASAVTLSVFSESQARMCELAAAYRDYADGKEWTVTRYFYKRYREAIDPDSPKFDEKLSRTTPHPVLRLLAREDQESADAESPEQNDAIQRKLIDVYRAPEREPMSEDVAGVGLFIRGDAAFSILESEYGRHEFGDRAQRDHCVVETSPGPLVSYSPPRDVLRRSFLQRAERRRRYDFAAPTVQDFALKTNLKPPNDSLSHALSIVIDANLSAQLESLLED